MSKTTNKFSPEVRQRAVRLQDREEVRPARVSVDQAALGDVVRDPHLPQPFELQLDRDVEHARVAVRFLAAGGLLRAVPRDVSGERGFRVRNGADRGADAGSAASAGGISVDFSRFPAAAASEAAARSASVPRRFDGSVLRSQSSSASAASIVPSGRNAARIRPSSRALRTALSLTPRRRAYSRMPRPTSAPGASVLASPQGRGPEKTLGWRKRADSRTLRLSPPQGKDPKGSLLCRGLRALPPHRLHHSSLLSATCTRIRDGVSGGLVLQLRIPLHSDSVSESWRFGHGNFGLVWNIGELVGGVGGF